MAAPPKPWERRGIQRNNLDLPVDQNHLGQQVDHRSTTALFNSGSRGFNSRVAQRAPPPLPSRPGQQSSLFSSGPMNRHGYGGIGSYGGMYGNYGGMHSSYGGGMYGGGLYGQRPLGMGPGNDNYSHFVQQAEESSRPAFQSIESIVQAFASVSMMLESTFHTVYNSFRAVLGVAEHFSRLKIHLAKIFSAIALFRFLRYVYRRLLVLLGLRTPEFAEDIWKEAESQAADGALALLPNSKQKKTPSWPIFMFFAVVVGGPYIIWKLLSSSEDASESSPEWASGEEDHVVARAEYDFDGDGEKELSFHTGDILNLAPKELQPRVRGWLLASSKGEKLGLVPANYVKILGKRRGRKYAQNEQQQNQQKTPPLTKVLSETTESRSGAQRDSVLRPSTVPSGLGQDQSIASDFDGDFLTASGPASGGAGFADHGQPPADLEPDFVLSPTNANNSNSIYVDEQQREFVGFDDTYWPGSTDRSDADKSGS